jgi:CheY-like chemotaxis protein
MCVEQQVVAFGWASGYYFATRGLMFWKKKKVEFSSKDRLPMSVIKDRARLLFIDDQPVPLVDLLQAEGWRVEYWKDVKTLQRLEDGSFDLVFLDIRGVGNAYSPDDEGLELIRRIKSRNPALILIAFTGETFDAEKTRFFQLADGQLNKSSGGLKAIEMVEELLAERWTGERLWDDVKSILRESGVPETQVSELEDKVARLGLTPTGGLPNLLKEIDSGSLVVGSTLSLLSKLSSIVSLFLRN